MDNITTFKEMLELVVKYDWAVEGASAPSDCKLSREGATKMNYPKQWSEYQLTSSDAASVDNGQELMDWRG